MMYLVRRRRRSARPCRAVMCVSYTTSVRRRLRGGRTTMLATVDVFVGESVEAVFTRAMRSTGAVVAVMQGQAWSCGWCLSQWKHVNPSCGSALSVGQTSQTHPRKLRFGLSWLVLLLVLRWPLCNSLRCSPDTMQAMAQRAATEDRLQRGRLPELDPIVSMAILGNEHQGRPCGAEFRVM